VERKKTKSRKREGVEKRGDNGRVLEWEDVKYGKVQGLGRGRVSKLVSRVGGAKKS